MYTNFIDCETSVIINEGPPVTKQINERWYLCIVMEHVGRGDLLKLIEDHKQSKQLI